MCQCRWEWVGIDAGIFEQVGDASIIEWVGVGGAVLGRIDVEGVHRCRHVQRH